MRYAVFSLLLFWAASAAGQSLTVKVVDERNRPLRGTEVFLSPGNILQTTGADGLAVMGEVASDSVGIVLFKVGRQSFSTEVRILGDTVLTYVLGPLTRQLETFVVRQSEGRNFGMRAMRSIEGTAIYAGKKTEVLAPGEMEANKAANSARQVYARIPGVNVWESDAAGIQLGIGVRGLSPNRTANINVRQNGYDISADALGYPESYYTPPLEAVERIEFVRGAASLQYGTQFGGMMNFVLKQGPEDRPIAVESRQTLGSYGFFSSFNSLAGTVGKTSYYTFYQYKTGHSQRPNSGFDVHTAFAGATYRFNEDWSLGAELTHMDYRAQQPGGLTDRQFEQDPHQSTRDRNWFDVDWNLAALRLKGKLSPKTDLDMRVFGLLARRQTVGYLGRPDRTDDPASPRDLIRGDFANLGAEARVLHRYTLAKRRSAVLVGARLYRGNTDSRQGRSPLGSGPDFRFEATDSHLASDYNFRNLNAAAFAENVFFVTDRFTLTPGLRVEYLDTRADGYYLNTVRDQVGHIIESTHTPENRDRTRMFALAGLGLSYKTASGTEWYANASQNYRAINFSDIRIENPSLRIDPDIGDERGYNLDMGMRATGRRWAYDAGVFYLAYQNRIGAVQMRDPETFQFYRLRANIADSYAVGFEGYAEWEALPADSVRSLGISLFANGSYTRARYVGAEDKAVDGNRVELTPEYTVRTGVRAVCGKFHATWMLSHIADQYTEATNAVSTPGGVNGLVPAYTVMDLSMAYRMKHVSIEAGVNNLADADYFTRRAAGYPGPGIIPSEGRSVYVTLGVNF